MITIAKTLVWHAVVTVLLTGIAAGPGTAQIPAPAGIRVRPSSEYPLMRPDTVAAAKREELAPSRLEIGVRSAGIASGMAALGGALGFTVDMVVCKQHKDSRPSESELGPCWLPPLDGTATGWFGGALLGATTAAATGAQQRGCVAHRAWWRAVAGASVGVLPGVLLAASRPEHLAPSRSAVLLSAPLLAGAGATIAVAGCHR